MRRLVFLIVLTASLGLVASATAAPQYARMRADNAPAHGCFSGGHTYSHRDTPFGQSGYQAGIPANDISFQVQITPMAGGLSSTDDFNALFYDVGSGKVDVQGGSYLGWAYGNGWNNTGTSQYQSSWHNYVEYINDNAAPPNNYYFADLGPTSGTATVQITQSHTNGAFYVYVNNVLSLSAYVPSTGSGRLSTMQTENYNYGNSVCDVLDGYFYQTVINPNYNDTLNFRDLPFTYCYNSRDWEGWNKNYNASALHGPAGNPGIWSCKI